MLKKQQMIEEKKKAQKSSNCKLPTEWESPPKHLKGKEIGLFSFLMMFSHRFMYLNFNKLLPSRIMVP